MVDQVDKLRVIVEMVGAEQAAADLNKVGAGLDKTGAAADKANPAVKQVGKEVEDVGAKAKTASTGVGGLARELGQGDWRGAALQFASMGNAIGGVGGVVRLVTVAVAAAGVAYYKGYQESKQFNNSLILTGNYAGLVAGQLDGMSVKLARAANTTVGGARETLQALVSTGRFTGDTLEAAGRAIELVAKYSGRTRADVVADFAKMSDGVTKWAVNANQQYHFLSLAQYEQIKLLEKQGKASEAAKLAMEAMSTSMGSQIAPAIGSLERGWDNLEKAASRAWNAMKGIGRQQTTLDRLETASGGVADATASFEAARRNNSGSALDGALVRKTQEDLKRALVLQGIAQSDARLERAAALNRAEAAEAAAEAIKKAEAKEKPGRIAGLGGAGRVDPEIEARRRLLSEMSGYTADYEQKVQRLVFLRNSEQISVERFNQAINELVASQPGQRAAAKEREDLAKAEAFHLKDLADTRARANDMAARAVEGQERELAALMASNTQLEQQAQQVGLTTEQMARLTLARLDAAIAAERLELIGKQSIAGAEGEVAVIERRIRLLERQRVLTADLGDKQVAQEGRKKAEDESRRFGEDVRRELTDGLMRGFEAGKDPARNLADTVGNMLKTRITRALAESIANPILRPLEDVLRGVTGGGGGSSGGGVLGGGFETFGGSIWETLGGFFGLSHGGGMVGREHSGYRAVNPAVFAGAPRFHGGGIVGDEVPIIAKKTEGVFTQGQMKALAPVGSAAPQITVNVHTLPGQTASVQQRRGGEGMSIDVIVRQLEEQLADGVASGSGALGQAIEGRYNLRTAVS